MKRIILSYCSILLVILFITSNANADHLSRTIIQNGVRCSEQWKLEIDHIIESASEEEMNKQIGAVIMSDIDVMQTVLLMTMELEADVNNELGMITPLQEAYVNETAIYIETGLMRPADIDYAFSSSLIFEEKYCSMIYRLYDKESNELCEISKVEIGQHENDRLVLYNHYSTIMDTTDRAAMLFMNGELKDPIFTVTVGKKLDLWLNVKEWVNGTPIEKWDTQLLYGIE